MPPPARHGRRMPTHSVAQRCMEEASPVSGCRSPLTTTHTTVPGWGKPVHKDDRTSPNTNTPTHTQPRIPGSPPRQARRRVRIPPLQGAGANSTARVYLASTERAEIVTCRGEKTAVNPSRLFVGRQRLPLLPPVRKNNQARKHTSTHARAHSRTHARTPAQVPGR